jgi:LemA protein
VAAEHLGIGNNKRRYDMAVIVVLVFGVVFVLWYVASYNGLVSSRNESEQCWSNVEVELKRRLDLVDNLVETVQGYAAHEKETFLAVVKARQQAASATGAEMAGAAEGLLTQSLRGLLAVAEAYPALKADARFGDLQAQLVEMENRIAARRTTYNQAAKDFRDRCQSFPGVLVANLHSFTPLPFFDLPDEQLASPPKVSFR